MAAGFSLHGNHARSISLPIARPTSRTTRQSDDLGKKLKNMAEIRHGISILTNLYKDIDEILGAPITRRAFARHRHDKWVEGWLEESVVHLDICSTAREAVSLVKLRKLKKEATNSKDWAFSMRSGCEDQNLVEVVSILRPSASMRVSRVS